MVGYVYFPKTGALPTSSDTAIKVATSAGTVVGQLGFGFLADHLGRKKVIESSLLAAADDRCTALS
jgi:MFS transporter, PHS family, inorganic phosphate transporter